MPYAQDAQSYIGADSMPMVLLPIIHAPNSLSPEQMDAQGWAAAQAQSALLQLLVTSRLLYYYFACMSPETRTSEVLRMLCMQTANADRACLALS